MSPANAFFYIPVCATVGWVPIREFDLPRELKLQKAFPNEICGHSEFVYCEHETLLRSGMFHIVTAVM